MHRASLRCALGLLIVVALCAGCGSSGSSGSSDSSKVSPANYVASVCSAISPLEHDVVTRTNALKNSTAKNASEAKTKLAGFLSAVEQDSDHALSGIKSAGTPDVSDGKAVAGRIARTFTQLRDTMRSAVTKAGSLPTDSPGSFQTAARSLLSGVGASLDQIAVGLNNADLEKAAAKQAACKNLNG